ncbi:MAG: asparagine--tRNA ligase [Proteobacteria bacterium]|nr:asparagine--tRNA ligase [Pseudomonadota bacterium]
MQQVRLADLARGKIAVGEVVCIQGWVRTKRESKAGVAFVHVFDGSWVDAYQVVVSRELPNFDSSVACLSSGCAVRIVGTHQLSQGKGQQTEVLAHRVEVVGWVDHPDTYPVAPKRHSMEYLRQIAHLRPRTNTFAAIARLRHELTQAVHRFFCKNHFVWVNTPIITTSDCEGAGEAFTVTTLDPDTAARDSQGKVDFRHDFFHRKAFLTVSGQLGLEAYCQGMGRVYSFGPTFRAENSNTSRHLAEFWMIEPEIAFCDLHQNADWAEAFLKYVFREALDRCDEDMRFFAKHFDKHSIDRLEQVVEQPFVRMDYTEAIHLLERAPRQFTFPVAWGVNLQSEHERYLTEQVVKRPLVVMNYPREIKPFYMRVNDDGKTLAAMDVLVPGIGEIIGGSQREERLEELDTRMAELGLDAEDYAWYRDLRRYGTVPHAGFGLGLERALLYLSGMDNIRDVIPFPRTPGSAAF